MNNFTNKKVKLNHESLIQNELDYMEELSQSVFDDEPNDSKSKALYDLAKFYKSCSSEQRLEEAKSYYSTHLKTNEFHLNYLSLKDYDEYECVFDGNNKSEEFPYHIRDINYNEFTPWCKIVRNDMDFYIEKRFLMLVE